jgi:hypothetical protein
MPELPETQESNSAVPSPGMSICMKARTDVLHPPMLVDIQINGLSLHSQAVSRIIGDGNKVAKKHLFPLEPSSSRG